jgi:hypothetical protein
MDEIWRDVIGFEGYYSVSNTGKVKALPRGVKNPFGTLSFRKGGTLKLKKGRYLRVSLIKNAHTTCLSVHRLVAIAFLDNPYNLPEVNHIDKNKHNNNSNNLEWISRRENETYKNDISKSSKYVGVNFKNGKWQARISINKKSLYLGVFINEDEAANAYKIALKKNGLINKYATI